MLDKLETSASARRHQEVFAYWASLRIGGRLPSRAQLDPAQLKRLLPTISLIDVVTHEAGHFFRQRLAGTGLFSVYGFEITGRRLDEIYGEGEVSYWREHLNTVAESARPAVGCQPVASRSGGVSQLLWMRLPLATDGRIVDMILGYDVVLSSPASRLPSGIRAA